MRNLANILFEGVRVSGRGRSSPVSIWSTGGVEPRGSLKGGSMPPCRPEQCNERSVASKGKGQ